MSGEKINYKRHPGLNIGQYFQGHEHEDPRNSQVLQTKGTICLGPSVNEQGGLKLMSLNLAKILLEGVGTSS